MREISFLVPELLLTLSYPGSAKLVSEFVSIDAPLKLREVLMLRRAVRILDSLDSVRSIELNNGGLEQGD